MSSLCTNTHKCTPKLVHIAHISCCNGLQARRDARFPAFVFQASCNRFLRNPPLDSATIENEKKRRVCPLPASRRFASSPSSPRRRLVAWPDFSALVGCRRRVVATLRDSGRWPTLTVPSRHTTTFFSFFAGHLVWDVLKRNRSLG